MAVLLNEEGRSLSLVSEECVGDGTGRNHGNAKRLGYVTSFVNLYHASLSYVVQGNRFLVLATLQPLLIRSHSPGDRSQI